MPVPGHNQSSPAAAGPDLRPPVYGERSEPVFWRVEGSLVNLRAVRTVGFFTWNAQSFLERWVRRGSLLLLWLVRPLAYAAHRKAATRLLHALYRGISRDRLDLLGEEYFTYRMKPRLKPAGVALLRERLAAGERIVLVSQALEHVTRPLAEYLGVAELVSNRLEFRDGRATGRLAGPVIRPRGGLALLMGGAPDGRVPLPQLLRSLGLEETPALLHAAVRPARREVQAPPRRVVRFEADGRPEGFSVRGALAGKHVLLVGVTGFIGKVWLAKLLGDLPEIGKVYLLIRPQRNAGGVRRFERIVCESPVFDPLEQRYGQDLANFLAGRVEVVEGDVSQPGLGLEPGVRQRLQASLDVVVNCAGLTDFNPDLREALATNVDAVAHLVEFLRGCPRAALLHLSTCYVVGQRDGRIAEAIAPDYTPGNVPGFDAEGEWKALYEVVRSAEARAESSAVTEELRQQARERNRGKADAQLEEHVRRYRARWLRTELIEAGMRRARELGWPNTYTLTKSLGESLIARRGAGLPIAVVRPSIVESSLAEPFRGWNEGVGTSAPLAYLLGTYFRQLPSNERKCLDLIPVDLVARGMTLIAAALAARRHQPLYQLATSTRNPCTMGRSIELTGLAHRKHYRGQEGLAAWLRSRMDTIAVSRARYQRLSAPQQKKIVGTINRIFAPLPWKPAGLVRQERALERVEKIIELYLPFILDNDHVFEAARVELLSAALPADEQAAFGYDPAVIDWWDYWINLHVPALRRWCYPLIEGRRLEMAPRRQFRLAPADAAAGPEPAGSGAAAAP